MSLDRRDFLAAGLALFPAALAADSAKKEKSPFLQGNYAPVREETTADDLKVVGKLPRNMEGMFVRNGPNPRFEPKGRYHWFDGDGMLHGVRVAGGKASYRSRYVRTDGWKEEDRAGKALYGGMMDLPDLKRLREGKAHKNTANTALAWHNGRLLALWEGGPPHEIKVPGLETVGPFRFGGKLRHACTAHPKIDPQTGEFLFFGYQPTRPFLRYSIADNKGVITRTTAVEIPRAVMMHDFAVTARHTVFMDLPVVFDLGSMLRGKGPFVYRPRYGARFGVLPRHGQAKEVKWFEAKPCFVFHVLNAHDDGDAVELLACRMGEFPATLTPPEQMSDRELKQSGSRLYRWRFDLKTGKTKEEEVGDTPADFPRINESLVGRKARYGYLMPLKMDALLKYDLAKGSWQRHELGKGRLAGEPVFVPRPGGKGEDDGWLVSYVYDSATKKSEMLVLESRDFTAKPVARVLLPGRVPFGFHGAWVPGV